MRARLLIALVLLAGLVAAQQVPSYKDLKYPPLGQVRIPDIETATLPNGMKLFLLENRELPLISGAALVRTGNLFDPPDEIGLAEFTGEVMRSGGTSDKTGDEIDTALENIAASVESGIGETNGRVSFSCLKENVDEVLGVFYQILTAPAFRQDKLDLAKTQTRSLIARRNDDPGGIASREFLETLYGRDTPFGWRMEYEDVDRISRDDLVAFHRRYFFPANILLAVQGDFDAGEMRQKLEKLFAAWTVTQEPAPPFPAVTAKPAPGIRLAVKDDVTQTFLRIGHLGGLLKDPDYPALEVMADILGGGFSSRLFKKVRTEKGWAYNVGAAWGANYNHPGVFRVSASTKSASTTDTIEVILQEVARLRSDEVTDEELQGAKDTVLNSFVFAFDQPSETLNRMVSYNYYGYPEDFIFQYQKAVAAVTKADVMRVAREHLRPGEFTIVAVGKQADFGRPLAELGLPIHMVDLTIPEPPRPEASPADVAQAKALLQRMQQAAGGADNLAALKDVTQTGTFQIQGGGISGKQTNQWLAPGTFRQEQQLPFGKMIVYFDGESGWLSSPQGTQALDPNVVDQLRGEVFRFLPTLLLSDRDPGRQLNMAGDNTVEISGQGGARVRVEVDPSTGLPARLLYQQSGSELVSALADWREVNGIRMPFHVTVSRAGQVAAEVTADEIRANTGLTAEELKAQP